MSLKCGLRLEAAPFQGEDSASYQVPYPVPKRYRHGIFLLREHLRDTSCPSTRPERRVNFCSSSASSIFKLNFNLLFVARWAYIVTKNFNGTSYLACTLLFAFPHADGEVRQGSLLGIVCCHAIPLCHPDSARGLLA